MKEYLKSKKDVKPGDLVYYDGDRMSLKGKIFEVMEDMYSTSGFFININTSKVVPEWSSNKDGGYNVVVSNCYIVEKKCTLYPIF
jgi:hypothetical protein